MAKPKTLGNSSTAKERSDANRQHHAELIGHTLDAATYGGHGHAVGKQGDRGHTMVQSDHAAQKDSYIGQGDLGNKSPDGADAENDQDVDDQAKVDRKA